MIRQFILMMCFYSITVSAQQLSLDNCKQLAHDNYPAIRQYDLIEQAKDYTMENASKSWLPHIRLNINGLAFTNLMDESPMMQQAGLNTKNTVAMGSIILQQSIYDGGKISAARGVTAEQAEVQKQQLDVTLYELNQRIEQLYFGILTIDEQILQTQILKDDLMLSSKSISSMIKGGIANESDLDVVTVAELKCEQTLDAQYSSRRAFLQMLGYFIGKTLGDDTQLVKPTINEENFSTYTNELTNFSINRPELSFFDAQSKLADAQEKQLNRNLLPTISAFGMGMYHTQLLDVIKNSLLAGGVTLSWNIDALYTHKNDLHKLEIQHQQIENQRAIFLFNNHLQSQSTTGNIEMLKKQLAHDGKIIELRERIRSKSEKKVGLGTESVNEMLRDINAVNDARQQQALHQIQLIKEIYSYKTNKGL